MAETFENQKIIIVSNEPADKAHPYTVINLSAMRSAFAQLKNSEYKLWCYLAMNQNKYQFALSCVTVCRETNISVKTYHTAVKALEEKGYLVKDHGNTYIFYELPTKDTDPATPIDKEIIVPEGKVKESTEFHF